MNTRQLEYVMRTDPVVRTKFCGVFAENNLPRTLDVYPCGFIANTDPKDQPGKHWVAFYFPSVQEGEFFDSYGHAPEFYSPHFTKFLNQHCQEWTFNNKTLQSTLTAVCGEYCVFYLAHRARGVSKSRVVNRFTLNTMTNDHQVYQFVMKLFIQ